MPIKVERKLDKEIHKKGLTGERANAYKYGVLRKLGWKPQRERK